MDWASPLWVAMKAAIKGAWPDVTAIWRETQIEKVKWLDKLKDAQLVPPWVVVHQPGYVQDTQWGADKLVYRVQFNVYYIAKDGVVSDMAGLLQTKPIALIDYLLANDTGFFLYPDGIMADGSSANPVNASMLDDSLPFSSIMTGFAMQGGFVT